MAPYRDSSAVWFVTGCSTGIGKAMATHVYNAGHTIVATARNVNSLKYLPENPKVLKLSLDVASNDSIVSAIDAAVKQFGRIDVVINNAAYGSLSEAEGFPEDEARLQMETNFWGPVKITKECLRVFKEVNTPGQGGTIVQVSSIGGFLGFEGTAIYNATKFALEGFTKGVAKEVNPKWKIKFLILSPGGVRTNFTQNMKFLPRLPVYSDDPESPLNRLIAYASDPKSRENNVTPDVCAAVLFDAVLGQNERPLPIRLNFGVETLPLIRADVHKSLKEMDEWEKEALKGASLKGSGEGLLNVLKG